MKLYEASLLYVDDNPHSRELMRLILTKMARVKMFIFFEDSQNFLARVQGIQPRPDIILLDIQIKPIDGVEMLRQLRADPALCYAQIVAITAGGMNGEINRLKTLGFDSAIGKPLNLRDFPILLEKIAAGESVWRSSY